MLAGYCVLVVEDGDRALVVPCRSARSTPVPVHRAGAGRDRGLPARRGVAGRVRVFRPLRTAAPLAKLAASLGLLLVAQAVRLARVRDRDEAAAAGAAGRHRHGLRLERADRPLHPAGHRPRLDARALARLPLLALRARDAGGLGERGRRHADRASRRTASRSPARCWRHSSRAAWESWRPRSSSSTHRPCRSRSFRRSPPRSSRASPRSGSPAWSVSRSARSNRSSTTSRSRAGSRRTTAWRCRASSPCSSSC